MRRRDVVDEKDPKRDQDKGQEQAQNSKIRMFNIRRLMILFFCLTIISVIVYVYIYSLAKTPEFKFSSKLQEIYDKHGAGEAKPRRRPELRDIELENKVENEEGIGDSTNKNREMVVDDVEKVSDPELVKNSDDIMKESQRHLPPDNSIHVAIVACGNRAPEAIISLKSFAMFSKRNLHFHVFAEEELHKEFRTKIQAWPRFIDGTVKLDIQKIQFPGSDDFERWKSLFKPCASQRLFLPLLLTEVDSVIYVDTDILLLRPPEDLWQFFTQFNQTQLAGLAPEAEVDAIGWYNRFAQHPYYGRLGVNSGIMLMNLTRMREANWNKDVYPISQKYRYDITWGDQDILNIMFHFKPEQLFVFSCEWNYRSDHCMYGNNCEAALERGISVVHGSRQIFHNEKQPEFKAVYEAFEEFRLGENNIKDLKTRIDSNLVKFSSTYCGEVRHLFSQQIGAA